MTAADPPGDSRLAGLASPGADAAGPLLLAFGLIALAVGLFWPSIEALAQLWSHPERRTYQHGYLIAALSLWLVFSQRSRLAAAAGPSCWSLLGAAAAGGIAWAIAWNAGLQIVHFLIWPAVLWAAIAGVLGVRAGRVLLFPVGFTYFAIPIWDALMPPLQDATVRANQMLAWIINMPVIIEDRYVHIPEGSFEIAGGCSGLNYLLVGLAVSTLLGELNRDPLKRRVLLVVLGGGMAIVSNWVRVFIVVFAGHVSNMQHYLVKVDHYNFGWVLYAFVLVAFFLIVRRLPETKRTEVDPVAATGSRAGLAAVAAAGVAMAIGPVLAEASGLVARRDMSAGAPNVTGLDFADNDEWRAVPASGEWIPAFPGADAESLADFIQADQLVSVYTATYLRQEQGRELIGQESRIQGSGRGRLHMSGTRQVEGTRDLEVTEAEWREAAGGRALIWWVYQIGERRFTSAMAAQLWYGAAALISSPVSSVVALRAPCAPDCGQARTILDRFAAQRLPDLLAAVARSGE